MDLKAVALAHGKSRKGDRSYLIASDRLEVTLPLQSPFVGLALPTLLAHLVLNVG